MTSTSGAGVHKGFTLEGALVVASLVDLLLDEVNAPNVASLGGPYAARWFVPLPYALTRKEYRTSGPHGKERPARLIVLLTIPLFVSNMSVMMRSL